MSRTWFVVFLLFSLLLAQCTPAAPSAAPTAAPSPTTKAVVNSPTPIPPSPTPLPPTATVTPAPTATATKIPGPPAEPQKVSFQAADGQKLNGTYYPAEACPPKMTVVLYHWAGEDETSWVAVAPWLQKRGLQPAAPTTKNKAPWHDLSWFPPNPNSYAVFTFTFRGCEGANGCTRFDPAGWLKDAKAAFETAQKQTCANASKIVNIGASIGADGAVDACGDACLGAVSLSPGSYLGIPYSQAAKELDAKNKKVLCIASQGDKESAPTCQSVSGTNITVKMSSTSNHGMALIQKDLDVKTLNEILAFLEAFK